MANLRIPRRITAVLTVSLLAAGVAPAAANHRDPANGTEHEFGEMVAYDLTFPVAGEHRYTDTFWATRGSGVHHAQDIVADKMTPVVAAASGTVTYVNFSRNPDDLNESRCCTMVIAHNDGWESWYIHLNNDTPGTDDGDGWGIAPGIIPGMAVSAGQLVGWVGDSGNAEGTISHLHFELYDPEGILVNAYDALRTTQGQIPPCSAGSAADYRTLLEGTDLLRAGSRGSQIRELQSFLSALGHSVGPVDGAFGPMTLGAVRRFQADRGATVDGVVGGETRRQIEALAGVLSASSVLAPTGPVLRVGSRGDEVRRLQQLLRVAGHPAGVADGAFGPNTESAVEAFQKTSRIGVDGAVGPTTRSALADALGFHSLPCG